MLKTCIYLRKSRADEEAEKRGEGETLSKHRKTLLKVANNLNLNVVKIREEIVSGESLMHRPEMLELLKEIEANTYDAVLCMDVDRLGRGGMQEQGLILETFKKANTKIITPRKTYDLHDEFDEEYSEFEAFMARKELKIINRRLQSGRVRSVEDGNYMSPIPPFGYEIDYIDKNRTLKPHPEQSKIVEMIFQWYIDGLGCGKICNKLNEMNIKTALGRKWGHSSVMAIIKNPIYVGKVTWKKKDIRKSTKPNKKKEQRTRDKEEWIVADGKHSAIISEELFYKAQEILNNRGHVATPREMTNPLAGLIVCGICGYRMVARPYVNKPTYMRCYYADCPTVSSRLEYVERAILEGLREQLKNYETRWDLEEKGNGKIEVLENSIKLLKKEEKELEKQKSSLHDFLERGIYDVDTYLERSQNLADRIEKIQANIITAKKVVKEEKQKEAAKNDIVPTTRHVLDAYYKTKDVAEKNRLLKLVLNYAEYHKVKPQRNDDFTLKLHLKLPTRNV